MLRTLGEEVSMSENIRDSLTERTARQLEQFKAIRRRFNAGRSSQAMASDEFILRLMELQQQQEQTDAIRAQADAQHELASAVHQLSNALRGNNEQPALTFAAIIREILLLHDDNSIAAIDRDITDQLADTATKQMEAASTTADEQTAPDPFNIS